MFLFENYPTVDYDLKKNNKTQTVTDITVRFKLQEILENRTVVTYDYDVVEGERPDIIAHKYYEDASLDWIIILTNKIVDPVWEWPMDSVSFDNYIRKKYGSVSQAQAQVHHYEKIIQDRQTLFDGTVIPEKVLWTDRETFLTLDALQRREVDAYTYEIEQNEERSRIKILDEKYVPQLLNQIETIFE